MGPLRIEFVLYCDSVVRESDPIIPSTKTLDDGFVDSGSCQRMAGGLEYHSGHSGHTQWE